MAALCSQSDVKRTGRHTMLARDARTCCAVAFNNLLARFAVAAHGVGVARAARYFIGAELDHLDFRVQGFRVRDCAFNVGCLEAKHNVIVSVSYSVADKR